MTLAQINYKCLTIKNLNNKAMKEELGIPKEYLIDYNSLKVGDEVWDFGWGHGTVRELMGHDVYPVRVVFNEDWVTYTQDGRARMCHKRPTLFKSNPFAALKKQNLPRMVEVNDGGRWFRSELLADLSGTSGILHPFVTRSWDDSELLACDQVREIEPSQKEITLTTKEVFEILSKSKGVDASQIKIKDK